MRGEHIDGFSDEGDEIARGSSLLRTPLEEPLVGMMSERNISRSTLMGSDGWWDMNG